MRWMLLRAAVLLSACGDLQDGKNADPCKDMQFGDAQIQCLIHADLQAIEKRLQPPKAPKVVPPKCPAYDPDEVCDGECEAARGAAKEYKRKYESMCDLATAMCLEMKSLKHWELQDCADTCLFFGDEPAEKRKP